jgi:hypothetical protein
MNENLRAAIKTIETHHEMVKNDVDHWMNYELFTWNWWILVSFIVIPLGIWLKLVDRNRLLEILLFGTVVIILTSTLDAVGVDLKFWVYPVQFMPLTPRALPFDIFMVGITFMLLYQYFIKWRSFLLALLLMSVCFAFIGEPVSKKLNLVYYIRWKYYYSFFFYIILGVCIKALVDKCKNLYMMNDERKPKKNKS